MGFLSFSSSLIHIFSLFHRLVCLHSLCVWVKTREWGWTIVSCCLLFRIVLWLFSSLNWRILADTFGVVVMWRIIWWSSWSMDFLFYWFGIVWYFVYVLLLFLFKASLQLILYAHLLYIFAEFFFPTMCLLGITGFLIYFLV